MHGNDTLFEALEQILIKVVVSYPHHGFWAMASGAKSNTSRRSKRNLRVFQKAKVRFLRPLASVGLSSFMSHSQEAAASNRSLVVGPLVDEGLRLVDQLLAMCNYPISGKIDTLSLKKTFPLLWKAAPTKLIIPLQSSLTVSLPYDVSQAATHKPFPDNLPVFQGGSASFCVSSSDADDASTQNLTT